VTVVRVRGGNTPVVVQDRRPRQTVQNRNNTTTVREASSPIVVTARTTPVQVQDRRASVKVGSNIGRRGPPGTPGETEGATFLAEPGETIHGRRMVRVVDGRIYHPSLAEAAHASQVIGLALQAGNGPEPLLVRTGGYHEEASWNWTPGRLWCDEAGVLTQTPPSTGWVLPVGRALTPTRIEIDIDTPLMRA
jgi:hypothetical protein